VTGVTLPPLTHPRDSAGQSCGQHPCHRRCLPGDLRSPLLPHADVWVASRHQPL